MECDVSKNTAMETVHKMGQKQKVIYLHPFMKRITNSLIFSDSSSPNLNQMGTLLNAQRIVPNWNKISTPEGIKTSHL